ncbi:MAG: DUF871 domain-containing protein [Fusobacteriaceae bacterium]
MRELGISIYPGHSELQKDKEYIKLASKYGFTRIFTCLLSVEGDKEKIISNFKETIAYANSLGFKVIADVSPKIFSELNISYSNLKFFKELDVYGIRLDVGYTGNEESLMTFNEYGLKIEINMSNDTKYVDTIMDYKPDTHNLLGCHNFYPHGHTGLPRKYFQKCTKNFKSHGLTTSAFVNSTSSTFGPWPVDEGLCTLEEHRYLPIEIASKDLFKEGIDTVIISNCYASEEELKKMGQLKRNTLDLTVALVKNIPEVEKNIVLNFLHFNRGDINESLIRSTQSRVKYKGHNFSVFNPVDIKRGDIIVESSLYGHYAGELQIAKKDIKNTGKTNVVGRIKKEELYLLDSIKPWEKFVLKEEKE